MNSIININWFYISFKNDIKCIIKQYTMSLTKLLKPLKNKTVEIEITKGPISLIPSIIE